MTLVTVFGESNVTALGGIAAIEATLASDMEPTPCGARGLPIRVSKLHST
jgi:hypothetical protein